MKARFFSNNKYILRMLWKIKKGRVVGEYFYNTLNYVYWVFYDILFLKYLVESLENGKSFEQIMTFILIAMIGFAIPNILSAWYINVYKPKSEIGRAHV